MLGSELEDSHFRKKKLKSRALYRLPMVRPRKGMRVISPHSSKLFFFFVVLQWKTGRPPVCWERRRVTLSLHPWEEGSGDAGGDLVWCGCSWTHISIHCKCWLHDEQDCHGKCWVMLVTDGAT